MIRKQTKIWTTKDGTRLRICDMTDGHLNAAIELLERLAQAQEAEAMEAGYAMLNFLSGEMAIDDVERNLDYLEAHGIDPSEINPLYENLILERERRENMNLKSDSVETKCYRCQQKAMLNGYCAACGARD